LSLGEQARRKGIVLIPGLRFDVVATDCLTRYVSEKVNAPTQLEIATVTSITDKPSPGTVKSMLDSFPQGTLCRRGGRLVKIHTGQGEKRVRFIDQERTILPVTLGDLITAYHTTGISIITIFIGLSEPEVITYNLTEFMYRRLLSFAVIRRLAQRLANKLVRGPDEHTRIILL
jgi:short subunit dehydrogenase-like uncharacterized protein